MLLKQALFAIVLWTTPLVCATWSSPVQVSSPGVYCVHERKDSQGNALALWSTETNIQAARRVNGEHWREAQLVASVSSTYHDLAFDGSGNAYAMWATETGRSYSIYVATLPAGTDEWIPWGCIATQVGTLYYGPRLAVDANGNGLIVWTNGDIGIIPYTVYTARLEAGTTQWKIINRFVTNHFASATLRFYQSGTALLVWSDYNDAETQTLVKSALLTPGATKWSQPLIAAPIHGHDPVVKFDSQENAFVAYGGDDCPIGIAVATLPVGGNQWQALPASPAQGFLWDFDFSVDGQGNATLLWLDFDYNHDLETLSVSTFSSSAAKWSKPQTLASGKRYYEPRLGISENGHGVAAYVKVDALYIAEKLPGQNWSVPVAVTPSDYSSGPAPLFNANGEASLLYYFNDSLYTITQEANAQ